MSALDELTPQRQDFIVCQVCGRSALPGTKHWLNQPHKDILGLKVQRCPQHWTDWALRNTREGRTNHNRELMAEAQAQPIPTVHPYLEPWSPHALTDEELLAPIDGIGGNGFGANNARATAERIIKIRR